MIEEITEAEYHVMYVVSGGEKGYRPGSFYETLIEAMLRADRHNLERLRLGFPEYVEAVEAFRREELDAKFGTRR